MMNINKLLQQRFKSSEITCMQHVAITGDRVVLVEMVRAADSPNAVIFPALARRLDDVIWKA